MIFKEAFIQTYKLSNESESEVWERDLVHSDLQAIQEFYGLYENSLAKFIYPEDIKPLGEAFCEDLTRYAQNHRDAARLGQFLKFSAAGSLAKYFITRKVKEYARFWLKKALDDTIMAGIRETTPFARLNGLARKKMI